MVELAASLPYARPEGGTAAGFVAGGRLLHRIIAHGLALVLLAFLVGPVAGIAAMGLGWLLCRALGWWSSKRIGGITGDVLGACNEIVATVLLLAGAVFWKYITALGWCPF